MVDFPTRLSFDQLSSMFYLYFLSFKCTLIPPCGKLYADLNLFRSMGILFNSFLIFLLSRKVVLSSNIMVLIVSMDYISMLLFKNIFSGICLELFISCALFLIDRVLVISTSLSILRIINSFVNFTFSLVFF